MTSTLQRLNIWTIPQIYHKLCLKCEQCGKRLDPGNLVSHDEKVGTPHCALLTGSLTALGVTRSCSARGTFATPTTFLPPHLVHRDRFKSLSPSSLRLAAAYRQ